MVDTAAVNPLGGAGDRKPVPDPTVLTTDQIRREINTLRELLECSINGLQAVLLERFESVDKHLAIVEHQRIEQKSDTKAAVDAALTAQKEAVKEQTTASERAIAKSEMATTKQLDQLGATFATAITGVSASVADVKERVGRVESMRVGGQQQTQAIAAVIGIVVAVITIVTVLAASGAFTK